MEKQEIIKLVFSLSDPSGKLIPRATREKLTVIIADGALTYFFQDRKVTKNFATIEMIGDKKNNFPQTTVFNERTGKAVKIYPGKTKEEIREIVLEQIQQLNLNTKKRNG